MTYFRWDDHGNNIMKKVADFYRNQVNTDCVFIVDGGKIRGHGVILRSVSNYFERILKSEKDHKEITLKNIKFCDLKYVFDFIYFGNVEVPENQVTSFMKTAELLEVTVNGTNDVQELLPCRHFQGSHSGAGKAVAKEEARPVTGNSASSEGDDNNKSFPRAGATGAEGCEDGSRSEKIATVEWMTDDVLSTYNHCCAGTISEIEDKGNLFEIVKVEDTFLKKEIHHVGEEEDGDINIRSDMDLRDGDDEFKQSPFFFCDEAQQSSFNDDVEEDNSVGLCADPLFVSEEDMIDKKMISETVSSVPLVSEESAESQRPVEGSTVDINDDSLFHTEVDLKSEGDCTRGSCIPASSEEERNESRDATYNGKSEELEGKMPQLHRKESLVCRHCSYSTHSIRDLNHHLCTHTNEPSFFCNECNASFSQKSDLRLHILKHIGEKPYQCKFCSSSFSQLGHLKRHKRIHTGEKPYVCDICSSSFSELHNLKTHKRIHTGEKPFVCEICSYSCSVSSHVKRHKRIHTGEKPYVCDICSSSFSQLDSLKSHKRTHTGEKPFNCEICSSSFSEMSSLKKHKRIHTGEKPYVCDICSISFSILSSLKRHQRIHSGEKPYVCNICSATFSQLGSLKIHKQTHTGQKPYACDICSYSFSQLSSLKAHKRIHVDEKLFRLVKL